MLPCWGAFAVWGSASAIPVDPKVPYEQGDLGHNSTSFCTGQSSFAIFSVSWKKVFTEISDNGLNWPCKIMMYIMTDVFPEMLPYFPRCTQVCLQPFLIQGWSSIQQVLFPNSFRGDLLFKGDVFQSTIFFWDSLHHVSQTILSLYRISGVTVPISHSYQGITMHCAVATAWIHVPNTKSMSSSYSGSHPPDWGLDQ